MALRYLDLESGPNLTEVAKSVQASQEPVVLREAGEDIAVISPVDRDARPPVTKIVTGNDLDDLLSVAGSWADIDTDKLIDEIYKQRLVSTRPPIEL